MTPYPKCTLHRTQSWLGPIWYPSCFVRTFWEIDQETARARGVFIPATCPSGLTFELPILHGKLITWVHITPSTCHPSSQHMHQHLRNRYWWLSMITDIHCRACAQVKVPHTFLAEKSCLCLRTLHVIICRTCLIV